MSAETRVLVVDGHAALRDGLRHVLAPYDIAVVGGTRPGNGVRRMISSEHPDAVLVDLRTEELDAIDLIRDISRRDVHVIAWCDHCEERVVARALAAGALGFAYKDDDTSALADCIHSVAKGRRWLPDDMRNQEIDALLADGRARLSRREREILYLLSEGFSTEEVAERLILSAHTVRTHVKNAMRKLNASTRAHAIAIAMRDLSIR